MILSVIILLAVLFVIVLLCKTTDNINKKDRVIKSDSKVTTFITLGLLVFLLVAVITNNSTTSISAPRILCDDIMYPSKRVQSLTSLGICNKTTNTILISQEDFVFNCTYLDNTKDTKIANLTFGIHREKRIRSIQNIISSDNFQTYEDTVLVTIVNRGLIYLFFNWICSIEKNLGKRELELIKKSVIVIAADPQCYQILFDQQFNTISISSILPGVKISAKHPRGFGDNKIHSLKLAVYMLVYDMLNLNHNVFWFDTDIVWLQNPIKYFYNQKYMSSDLFLTSDGRYKMYHAFDMEGPMNAGVAFIRSNCRTIVAFETILSISGIVKPHYTPITDQGILNIVAQHSPLFSKLKVQQLPWYLFINGNIFHKSDIEQDLHKVKLNEIIMLHVSWTDGYQDKIKKFNAFNAYYYNHSSKCSYFNSSFLHFDYMDP